MCTIELWQGGASSLVRELEILGVVQGSKDLNGSISFNIMYLEESWAVFHSHSVLWLQIILNYRDFILTNHISPEV